MSAPPRHLVFGAFGIDVVTAKLKAALAKVEACRETGLVTAFSK